MTFGIFMTVVLVLLGVILACMMYESAVSQESHEGPPEGKLARLWHFHVWEYGVMDFEPGESPHTQDERPIKARRNRRTGEVQFVLWAKGSKQGEHLYEADYWQAYNKYWWPRFKPGVQGLKSQVSGLKGIESKEQWAGKFEAVEIDYTNWEGKRAVRMVIPERIFFGCNKWHPKPQWLLQAEDVEKSASRTFALKDIHRWGKAQGYGCDQSLKAEASGCCRCEKTAVYESVVEGQLTGERWCEGCKLQKDEEWSGCATAGFFVKLCSGVSCEVVSAPVENMSKVTAGGGLFDPKHLVSIERDPRTELRVEVLETDADGIVRAIEDLREDEGESVEIISRNADFNGEPNDTVDVVASWTNWEKKRFGGDTLLQALQAAVKAKREWEAAGKPQPRQDSRGENTQKEEGEPIRGRWDRLYQVDEKVWVRQVEAGMLPFFEAVVYSVSRERDGQVMYGVRHGEERLDGYTGDWLYPHGDEGKQAAVADAAREARRSLSALQLAISREEGKPRVRCKTCPSMVNLGEEVCADCRNQQQAEGKQ